MNIFNCNNTVDYEQFLLKLENDSDKELQRDLQLSGIGKGDLERKMLSLHNQALSSSPSSEVYLQTSSALYQLRKVLQDPRIENIRAKTFGQSANSELSQLEKLCIQQVRSNPVTMNRYLSRYNGLIQELEAKGKSCSEEERAKTLDQLNYLNQFIGVPWTQAQKKGKVLPPKWSWVGSTFSSPSPQSPEKLRDCETTSQLLDLVVQLRDSGIEVRKGTIREIEKRLIHLYQKEKNASSYSPLPLSYQTGMALSILRYLPQEPSKEGLVDFLAKPFLKTSNPNQKALAKIETDCLKAIQKDPPGNQLLKNSWNSVVQQMNDKIAEFLFHDEKEIQQSFTHLSQLRFLASATKLSLGPEQMSGRGFLPLQLDMKNPWEKKEGMKLYISYSSWFNDELTLRHLHSRKSEIESRLSSPRASLVHSQKELHQMFKELQNIEIELSVYPNPMPEEVFLSLFVSLRGLAKDLDINLSKEQAEGKQAFPLYGKEVLIPQNEWNSLRDLKPNQWERFADSVTFLNDSLLSYQKIRIKKELRFLEKQIFSDEADTEILKKDIANKKKWLDLYFKKKGLWKFSPERRRRWLQEFGLVLAFNDRFQFHLQPTKEQLEGTEAWPIPDITQAPPQPSKEELIANFCALIDLENDKNILSLTQEIEKMPIAWKKSIENEVLDIVREIKKK